MANRLPQPSMRVGAMLATVKHFHKVTTTASRIGMRNAGSSRAARAAALMFVHRMMAASQPPLGCHGLPQRKKFLYRLYYSSAASVSRSLFRHENLGSHRAIPPSLPPRDGRLPLRIRAYRHGGAAAGNAT